MSKLGVDRESVSTLSAKAAAEPLKFNASERSDFIRSHVAHINKMITIGRSNEEIKSVFPEFAEQYPALLEMLLRPSGFDEKSLSLMISMLEKMGSGKTSQHEASIKVGQHLMDTYVKPDLA
jgi:hypothetical protein